MVGVLGGPALFGTPSPDETVKPVEALLRWSCTAWRGAEGRRGGAGL